MPLHWTYGEFDREGDLLQGDIVSRDPRLVEVLHDVFPYFCHDRYIAFLVATQSCDLVRRAGSQPKAKYITLAVIRELRSLLPEWLEELCGTGVPGVYKKESRWNAEQLLVRVINQNEQARGVFYLHEDGDAGIAVPSVAMLRVTFSLRRAHYDLLREARCGRVQGEYANKLGWLAGNLFSRVATLDWEDQQDDAGASAKQAKRLLRSVTQGDGKDWVSEAWIEEARRKSVDLSALTPTNAYSALEAHAPPEPIETLIQRMDAIGREIMVDRDVKASLRQSADFLLAFAEEIVAVVSAVPAEQRQQVARSLAADSAFSDAVCNAVASVAKKVFKRLPADPVSELCDALAEQPGTIPTVLKGLRALVIAVVDADRLSSLKDEVLAAHLFTDGVLEHVRAVISSVESEYAERHRQIASRLRNDPTTKAVLRRASEVSSGGNA